jgi:hypothetical protein
MFNLTAEKRQPREQACESYTRTRTTIINRPGGQGPIVEGRNVAILTKYDYSMTKIKHSFIRPKEETRQIIRIICANVKV